MTTPRPQTVSQPSDLTTAWPRFLDDLHADPDVGFAAFYVFTVRLLAVCPPAPYRALDPSQREDALHDLMLHCCQEDFRVLLRYEDRGRPFAAWLLLVLRNRILDRYRRRRRSPEVSLTDEDGGERDPPAAQPEAGTRIDQFRLLDEVLVALEQLADECRLLIQGAADGMRPRELVRLLGWPADWNKKASDLLRDCRRRLWRVLESRGVGRHDLDAAFGD